MIKSVRSYHFIHQQQQHPEVPNSSYPCFLYSFLRKIIKCHHRFALNCRYFFHLYAEKITGSPIQKMLTLPFINHHQTILHHTHLLPIHVCTESSLQTANQRTRTAKHLPRPKLPVHTFSNVCLRESVFYHLHLPTATIQRTGSTTIFKCTFSVFVSLQRSPNSTILNQTASSSFTRMQRI